MLQEQEGNLEHARDYFQTALKKGAKPARLAEVHSHLGQINRQQGNDEQAVEHFAQALKHYSNGQSEEVLEVLVSLGELKIKYRWFTDAIEYGERAQQISTQSETLRQRLAKVFAEGYYGNHEYEQAEEHEQQYFQLCQEDQEKAESLLRLGMIHEHQTQYSKAADTYRKGLKFATTNQMLGQLNGTLKRRHWFCR
jgi:tetratricopeptide (TPR) repeat protein